MIRTVFFAAVCLATLAALFYAVENWRGKKAWDSFQQEWEARGERFEFSAFVQPPRPDDQNFAMTPLLKALFDYAPTPAGLVWRDTNAYARANSLDPFRHQAIRALAKPDLVAWNRMERIDLETWQAYYRASNETARLPSEMQERPLPLALKKRYGLADNIDAASAAAPAIISEFPIAARPQKPAEDVLLALSRFDSEIAELRMASQCTFARYPIRYEDGWSALLPHLAALKGLVQTMELRSLAELELGRTDQALTDIQLSFYVADTLRKEPILISYLVRAALYNFILQPVWEGLADHRWTEPQLAALQRQLDQTNLVADFFEDIRGERAFSNHTVDQLIHQPRQIERLGMDSGSGSGGRDIGVVLLEYGPRGWLYQNKVVLNRLTQEQINLAENSVGRHSFSRDVPAGKPAWEIELERPRLANIMARMFMPAVDGALMKALRAQSVIDLARVACALERYRLAQGQFPERLDALAPRYLGQLPLDLMNGQSLVYRRANDGQFRLYSVGANGIDDDGIDPVTLRKLKHGAPRDKVESGDWVWNYPAPQQAAR